MLAYMVEDLENKRKFELAKAIALRNGVMDLVRPEVKTKLEEIDATEAMNLDQPELCFGPISTPKEEYYQLPETCKVTFIGSVDDLPQLE